MTSEKENLYKKNPLTRMYRNNDAWSKHQEKLPLAAMDNHSYVTVSLWSLKAEAMHKELTNYAYIHDTKSH